MPLPVIAPALVAWQRQHGRHDLPWQDSRDPYRVWLSEVMLQQTQVATVIGYYGRFLDRFPDVQTLAAAPLDDVLAAWSGLGYYSRARNLHRCAQVVVCAHGGCFPDTAVQLAALPGIGRSTAAAIAAFCFGERVAILDGNVKRVLARVLAFDGDLAQARSVDRLWQMAQLLLPAAADIGPYTQGLMDLGATVCLPREPQCGRCPLRSACRAAAVGEPAAYPVKSRRLARGERRSALLWLERHDGAVWLVRRPAAGVWAGLWTLPAFDDIDRLRAALGPVGDTLAALPPVRHALTHFDWHLHPLRGTWRGATLPPAGPSGDASADGEGRWWMVSEALALGLPAPVRRLLAAG